MLFAPAPAGGSRESSLTTETGTTVKQCLKIRVIMVKKIIYFALSETIVIIVFPFLQ